MTLLLIYICVHISHAHLGIYLPDQSNVFLYLQKLRASYINTQIKKAKLTSRSLLSLRMAFHRKYVHTYKTNVITTSEE